MVENKFRLVSSGFLLHGESKRSLSEETCGPALLPGLR